MFRILISIINRITKSKIEGRYYEYPVLVGIAQYLALFFLILLLDSKYYPTTIIERKIFLNSK